ncbi:MAG: hypothetical protein E7598_06020 [Ruminococcaceae bacterium]|nr:hypothetical protein [Oscillospiraceae bacterium]
MKTLKTKLTSRKFLMAAAGVVSGIALILNGNSTEGMGAVITSVLGYLIAEGYIDAKALKAQLDKENSCNEEKKTV